jgi:hypothetical protein
VTQITRSEKLHHVYSWEMMSIRLSTLSWSLCRTAIAVPWSLQICIGIFMERSRKHNYEFTLNVVRISANNNMGTR